MTRDVIEALANAALGLAVSWAVTFLVLPPLFGIAPTAAQSAGITALFFGVSFARAWALRAVFRRLWE
jgi:hypothetical protein